MLTCVGCSDDDDDDRSVAGPGVEINCAQQPRSPGIGDTEVDVTCQRKRGE
jgi:hypothetical protein